MWSRLIFPLFVLLWALSVVLFWPHHAHTYDLTRDLALPSYSHPFGCGDNGVDLLALSARSILQSMTFAFVVACCAAILGAALGATCGFMGGVYAESMERACDFIQAFPSFVLALGLLSTIHRPTRWHIGALLLVAAWAPFARLALAELRLLRNLAYVEAAYALGVAPWRVFLKHILPATFPTLRAQFGSTAVALLISDAALAFLGVGPQQSASLGAFLDQGVGLLIRAPHVLLVSASSLVMASIALQQIADSKQKF